MPVDVSSRYRSLGSYPVTAPDGTTTTAIPARVLGDPITEDLYHHRLTGLENVEYLAWRYFGSSAAWWYIADANPLVFPLDLKPGATVEVPPASSVGRVLRTRSF